MFSIIFGCVLLNYICPFAETVKIGVYENPPKVHLDKSGRPCGIFIDIINYICEKEGWDIEYINGNWNDGLTRLEKGAIDIMPDVAFSESRAKRFDFNQLTVLSSWLQAYCRRDPLHEPPPFFLLRATTSENFSLIWDTNHSSMMDFLNRHSFPIFAAGIFCSWAQV